MSAKIDTVKRWWAQVQGSLPWPVPTVDYVPVVLASDYDAVVEQRDEARADIERTYDKVEMFKAQRDEARLQREHLNQQMIRLGCEKGELYQQYCDLESERDNLRRACDEKERIGDAFLVRSEKAEAERDSEQARHLITQRKLAEMWAERDALAATVEQTGRRGLGGA